jgi:hypothetical protein
MPDFSTQNLRKVMVDAARRIYWQHLVVEQDILVELNLGNLYRLTAALIIKRNWNFFATCLFF